MTEKTSWRPASAESRVVLHWLTADMLLRLIDVDSGGRQWHPKTTIPAKPACPTGTTTDKPCTRRHGGQARRRRFRKLRDLAGQLLPRWDKPTGSGISATHCEEATNSCRNPQMSMSCPGIARSTIRGSF